MNADAVDRLAIIAAAVRERRALPAADADFLLEVLPLLASRFTRRDLAARDRRVCAIADRFYPRLSRQAAASRIAAHMKHIAASVKWKTTIGGNCPFRVGTVQAEVWEALQAGGGKPVSVRQLRKIIGLGEREGQPTQV